MPAGLAAHYLVLAVFRTASTLVPDATRNRVHDSVRIRVRIHARVVTVNCIIFMPQPLVPHPQVVVRRGLKKVVLQ